jgi:hypothetical protein
LLAGDAWGIHIAMAGTDAEVRFSRITNRGFEIQWTTDLSNANSWQPLDVAGNEPIFSATNSDAKVQDTLMNALSKYYRVRILEP